MPGVITKLSGADAAIRTPSCMSWTDQRWSHILYTGQLLWQRRQNLPGKVD